MNTFSAGIEWDYIYKNNDNYVAPCYKNFKSEIMEYEHIDDNKELYDTEIYKKAVAYHQGDLVQSMKGGMMDDKIMPIDCLISIILYTDFTQLSAHFSSSFRAYNKYEPFESIRKRHQK